MGNIEKEVKVLDIDVNKVVNGLKKIGAIEIEKKKQKIYTYDVLSIYYRYIEAMELLKSDNDLLKLNSKRKLKLVLTEYADLEKSEELNKIYNELNIKDFNELLDNNDIDIYDALKKSKTLNKNIKKYLINPNKWVRLRQSNDKSELTIKHILHNKIDGFQNVLEYEIPVNNIEDTNEILEQLGLFSRNYQEKNRISFKYKDSSVEIDEWPMLKPYMEIETNNIDTINEIISKLSLENNKVVSLNTESLYKQIGIDVLKIPRLEFKKIKKVV
jgi:adenylate cyclase class 2